MSATLEAAARPSAGMRPQARPIAFNGKFLSGARTGVYRVARELVEGVDQLLAESYPTGGPDVRFLFPRDAEDLPEFRYLGERQLGALTWQPWEQIELPLRCREPLLVNLCNLAPLAMRHGVTMIHDAQVFLSPQSYSRPFRTWYQFALPRIGERSRFVLTVSEYSKEMLVRFGVAPAEKIRVLPNGVDHLAQAAAEPAVLTRLGLQPRGYVVALSNTQKHKNISRLFDAFRRPQLANARLVLVGAAGGAEFVAAGETPPANAVFAGRVSDGELRALLEGAAAMALPSLTEGFGLPPVEAMYLGCPAVVSPAGAIAEVCGAGALYADPESTDQWTDQILDLLEDHQAYAAASARGRAHAFDKTWRASSRQLLDWLLEAAAED